MRRELLFKLARIVSIFDCLILASYVIVGFFVSNLEFAWRLTLFGLALYAATGVRRRKRTAGWILAGFCSTAVLASMIQILALIHYPDTEFGQYVAPILAFCVYSLSLAGLYLCRDQFSPSKTERYSSQPRYVASLFLLGCIAAGSRSFASDHAPVSANRTLINFGKILRGTALQDSFRITNNSGSVLQLSAKPSCGCTILRVPDSLKPGETAELPFYVHTFGDRPGREEKSILVSWKDDKQNAGTIELRIEYEAMEAFLVYQSERELSLRRTEGILIWSWSVDNPPEIAAIEPNQLFTFTLEKLSTRRGKMLRLRAQPYRPLDGHGGDTIYAKLVTVSGGIIEIPFHIDNDISAAGREGGSEQ
jgi:hypothetical protein